LVVINGGGKQLQFQHIKRLYDIHSTLTITYRTYESGSKNIIEKGTITENANGEIKENILKVLNNNKGTTIIHLIYKDNDNEPVIKTIRK